MAGKRQTKNRLLPHRWQRTTWLSMLVPVYCAVIIAVPAHWHATAFAYGYETHGWPFVHFLNAPDEQLMDQVTHFADPLLRPCGLPYVSKGFSPESRSAWTYGSAYGEDEVSKWLIPELIANCLFWLTVLMIWGCSVQVMQRQKRKWYQLTTANMLAMASIVGIVFGYWSWMNYRAREECLAVHQLKEEYNIHLRWGRHHNPDTPIWISHLFWGNQKWWSVIVDLPDGEKTRWHWFQPVRQIVATSGNTNDGDPSELARLLSRFRNFESIEVHRADKALIDAISKTNPNLVSQVSTSMAEDFEDTKTRGDAVEVDLNLNFIADFKNLEYLEITQRALQRCDLDTLVLPSLHRCTIFTDNMNSELERWAQRQNRSAKVTFKRMEELPAAIQE